MSENNKILSELKKLCSEAESFLSKKQTDVKEKEGLVSDLKSLISDYKAKGIETKSLESTLKGFEEDLYKVEMNENDLIAENLYLIDATEIVSNFVGKPKTTYYSEKRRISDLKDKKKHIESLNDDYESRIKDIDGEDEQKNKLRLDIISNEDYIKSLESEFNSFDGNYKDLNDYVVKYDSQISKINQEVEGIKSELGELDFEIKSGFDAFNNAHKELVDRRMGFNALEAEASEVEHINNTYGTTSIELKEINSNSKTIQSELEEMGKKEKEIESKLDELKSSKDALTLKLKDKEVKISNLDKEKKVLERTNNSKSLNIKSLNGKLGAWESNYKEFEELVSSLEDFVGYPKYSNMEGDGVVEGVNPLIPLIERVKDITEFVEREQVAEDTGIKVTEEGEVGTRLEAEEKAKSLGSDKRLPTKSKMKKLFSSGGVKKNEPYWVEDSEEPVIFNDVGEMEVYTPKDGEPKIEVKYIVIERYVQPNGDVNPVGVTPYLLGAAATLGLMMMVKR